MSSAGALCRPDAMWDSLKGAGSTACLHWLCHHPANFTWEIRAEFTKDSYVKINCWKESIKVIYSFYSYGHDSLDCRLALCLYSLWLSISYNWTVHHMGKRPLCFILQSMGGLYTFLNTFETCQDGIKSHFIHPWRNVQGRESGSNMKCCNKIAILSFSLCQPRSDYYEANQSSSPPPLLGIQPGP